MATSENEDWKDIAIEGETLKARYAVSNLGRVKSYAYGGDGKVLRGTLIEGYPAVRFKNTDGRLINQYVHRLVAKYFLPDPRKNQHIVIHKDYDKTNNHAENLAWADHDEQIQHKMAGPNHQRGRITNAKLTVEQVREIKRMLKSGEHRPSQIARVFEVTITQINRIRNGENWADVTVD